MTLAAYRAGAILTEQPEIHAPRLRRVDPLRVSTPAEVAARALLGTLIVRDDEGGCRVGRIVETEAYAGPEDRASHARAGRTPRTNVMFGPAGRAYVYLVYGMHHCLNVVCATEGQAAAVLIRAVEPLAGLAAMRERRGAVSVPDSRIAADPARTCQALDIDRGHDGLDLLSDERLWLATDGSEPLPAECVMIGPRIGVEYAGPEWAARPWRFGVAGSPALSRPFPEPT